MDELYVKKICRMLVAHYGKPRFGNPYDPLDDLIYIILSNRTLPAAAQRAYKELKKKYPRWKKLAGDRPANVRKVLGPAGLSRIKTEHIRSSLKKLKSDFGRYSLDSLRGLPAEAVQAYLVGLRGVSLKVAKCVMMYTMGFEVLPVDTHVHRIARRLGWTERRRADQCHGELETLVPASLRAAFHVDCIAHGRIVCTPKNPACEECCIKKYCQYYRSVQ